MLSATDILSTLDTVNYLEEWVQNAESYQIISEF